MIAFPADSRRDLKGKQAAVSMARPAGSAKKVEADASEPRVPLACLFPMKPTAEARPVGAGKKMEETTALKKMEETTALKKMEEAKPVDSLWKEGEMLKLRQELWEAEDLYRETRRKALKGETVERKMPAVDKKKKKKLIRVICSDAYIDKIIKDPGMMPELSAKQIKKYPQKDRQSYRVLKVINAKARAYHHALIEQRHAFGFAYDELEVTDDDEKEVTDDQEVAVVKN